MPAYGADGACIVELRVNGEDWMMLLWEGAGRGTGTGRGTGSGWGTLSVVSLRMKASQKKKKEVLSVLFESVGCRVKGGGVGIGSPVWERERPLSARRRNYSSLFFF